MLFILTGGIDPCEKLLLRHILKYKGPDYSSLLGWTSSKGFDSTFATKV